MDLIVNINSLAPPLTGIGRYTQELLKCLIADQRVRDITGFGQLGIYDKQLLGGLVFEQHDQQSPMQNHAKLKKILRNIPGVYLLRDAMRQRQVRKIGRQHPGAVMWEPNYALLDYDGPSVATIHDLSYLRYPQYHHEAMLNWLNRQIPKTIQRADAFVTLSEFSKQELVRELAIDPEKIHIVPPAVDNAFRVKATLSQLQQVKQHYNLPDQYLLTVSTLEPRKNINGLIAAYSHLPETLRNQYPLVIVGAKGWGDQAYAQQYRALLNKGQLYFPGYVAQADLPVIFKGATLFAFLSYYEGYGMPVAEAMASGVAVLASDRASIPEVAQGSAVLVSPEDSDAATVGLNELLESPKLRQNMQERGRSIALDYTWEKSANLLVELCQNLTGPE